MLPTRLEWPQIAAGTSWTYKVVCVDKRAPLTPARAARYNVDMFHNLRIMSITFKVMGVLAEYQIFGYI